MIGFRLVNAQYTMEANMNLDLLWIHFNNDQSKYFPGKPHMLKWVSQFKKTVLFFPNNKVQVIGNVDENLVLQIQEEIVTKLRDIIDDSFFLSTPKVNTMTWTYKYDRTFSFVGIPSNSLFSYEPEVFPAAIFSHWAPIKVILFPNGHTNIVGVKTTTSLPSIIEELMCKYDALRGH